MSDSQTVWQTRFNSHPVFTTLRRIEQSHAGKKLPTPELSADYARLFKVLAHLQATLEEADPDLVSILPLNEIQRLLTDIQAHLLLFPLAAENSLPHANDLATRIFNFLPFLTAPKRFRGYALPAPAPAEEIEEPQ